MIICIGINIFQINPSNRQTAAIARATSHRSIAGRERTSTMHKMTARTAKKADDGGEKKGLPNVKSEIICEFIRVLSDPKSETAIKRTSGRGGFMNVLWQYIDETASCGGDVVISKYTTKHYVCVADKYPKARTHFLLLPRRDTGLCVDSVDRLTRKNAAQLRDFHAHATRIVEDVVKCSKGSMSSKDVQIGYHAVPSLRPLHLHIISCDFVSDCMKTKKHWNSFTTNFFMLPSTVESLLSASGDAACIRTRTSALKSALKMPLRCHRCLRPQKNMPVLKSHIRLGACSKGACVS